MLEKQICTILEDNRVSSAIISKVLEAFSDARATLIDEESPETFRHDHQHSVSAAPRKAGHLSIEDTLALDLNLLSMTSKPMLGPYDDLGLLGDPARP